MSYFPTTQWSLVLSVGHGSVETARNALEQLCRTYWYPLYAYARSRGESQHDAEDLIQGFFAELVQKELVTKARIDKGRFRSFLLQSFNLHRLKQRERSAALKRGGGSDIVSLEELHAEERFAAEPADGLTPERRFERDWAISVLDESHRRLASDYERCGKPEVFARLRGFLQAGGDAPGYATLAAETGKSEAALKMEVSRLRAQYRKLLREVVRETLADPAEAENELRYLLKVLSE
jgi:RNA polymerase sigma-70 factor (ECF subfamily)